MCSAIPSSEAICLFNIPVITNLNISYSLAVNELIKDLILSISLCFETSAELFSSASSIAVNSFFSNCNNDMIFIRASKQL